MKWFFSDEECSVLKLVDVGRVLSLKGFQRIFNLSVFSLHWRGVGLLIFFLPRDTLCQASWQTEQCSRGRTIFLRFEKLIDRRRFDG